MVCHSTTGAACQHEYPSNSIHSCDTVVIGGVLKSTKTWDEDRIPGLGQLPVVGWLFKSQSKTDDKNELLIFLTPQIVKLEQKKL